jgi:2-isopropylmalate synthase
MGLEQKLEFFSLLSKIGFKEIEIGFPAASDTEFKFCRQLVEEQRIPEGTTVQALTQAREEIIKKTIAALEGAPKAIVHLYNSTNPAQREIVFKKSKEQIKQIAVQGAKLVAQLTAESSSPTQWVFQYSPESFCLTELHFALEVCQAVYAVWKPTGHPIIFNLPSTVEASTPNVYADQIEWMTNRLPKDVTISVHTHNDRGTGVAATELALLAGATRVEGTLFGNGERTGNLDIVTVALNLLTQGISPNLDFSDLPAIREAYEKSTKMTVHDRHPYAGELVLTAFSGSHQDAIKKGLAHQKDKHSHQNVTWNVPYIPIDPADIGREIEMIRINSQSGKGGFVHILETQLGYSLPTLLHVEIGRHFKKVTDTLQREISADEALEEFFKEFLRPQGETQLISYQHAPHGDACMMRVTLNHQGNVVQKTQLAGGPIEALSKILSELKNRQIDVENYTEHATSQGKAAQAIAVIQLKSKQIGVGIHQNIETAALLALISASNA